MELELRDSNGRSSRGVSPPRTEYNLPAWRAELDQFYAEMNTFDTMDVGEVFMRLAAYSARVSEIRTHVVRHETRSMAAFRTREIDPFLEEVDRQFKMWSRTLTVREMEFRLSGGAV